MSVKNSVLVYLVDEDGVWLGMKKEGYAKGKWNGFGGKVNEEETLLQAAVREVKEETHLDILEKDLEECAEFYYDEPQGDWIVHIYICKNFHGDPKESDEMIPQKFDINQLPLDKMWANDSLWVGRILTERKKLDGKFWHDSEGKILNYRLKER